MKEFGKGKNLERGTLSWKNRLQKGYPLPLTDFRKMRACMCKGEQIGDSPDHMEGACLDCTHSPTPRPGPTHPAPQPDARALPKPSTPEQTTCLPPCSPIHGVGGQADTTSSQLHTHSILFCFPNSFPSIKKNHSL